MRTPHSKCAVKSRTSQVLVYSPNADSRAKLSRYLRSALPPMPQPNNHLGERTGQYQVAQRSAVPAPAGG